MKKLLTLGISLGALAATLTVQPSPSFAAGAPNAQEMKSLDYLIGTWSCSWTAGPDSGAVTSVFAPVMNGAWLQETETVQSPTRGPVVTTVHFTGFDPQKKRWVHLGPDADGSYAVAQSSDGETWHNLLPVAGSDATFRKMSDSAFALSEDFARDGKTLTYVETCKKAVPG
jgi:hypothetical protein